MGHLTLDPVGTITGVDWRLSLWNAELTGTITTNKGTLAFSALIHDGIFAARVKPEGEEEVRWTFHPEEAVSPRKISEAPPSGYVATPPWTTRTTGDEEPGDAGFAPARSRACRCPLAHEHAHACPLAHI
ncbi:hypothetical protein GCM10023083_84040 [Streptomyces phyllanthi]